MKSVLTSIKPKWCELIASGKKTIEIRKTRPKCDAPFKCYIYCTKEFYRKGDGYFQGKYCGKVIGEFVCDKIDKIDVIDHELMTYIQVNQKADMFVTQETCLEIDGLQKYLNNKTGYGWHISNLVIYDKPKDFTEFKKFNRECWYADLGIAKRDCPECKNAECFMQRPPQSWCYVEELKECADILTQTN